MSENIFYVYQLRLATESLPFYVGKGKGRRAWEHFATRSLEKNTHKNNTIKRALRDGVDVVVEMIFTGLLNSEALAYEVWAISAYGRKKQEDGCLSNQTLGGEGSLGHRPTDEQRAKISEALRARVVTQETRAKHSANHKGKVVSEASRRKLSDTKIAQKRRYTDDEKRAMSELLMGRVTSDETKVKMSLAMTGLKRSDEGKQNMRDAYKVMTKSKCPHCDVWAIKRQLSRYHNDNCKSLVK